MDVENSGLSSVEYLKEEIQRLKAERDAVIMAHYYQQPEVQDIADFIGDSLALAQQATKLPQKIIVLCGVHFMAETAAILCPDKTVIIPDPTAGCSLADSCPADEFAKFISEHPGHTVISYVNTSAQVKALSDILVTSSNARKIVESLPADTPIIFGPDHNLGSYINSVTSRNMVLWNGACHVHARFSVQGIIDLKKQYPGAPVLAHPECPKSVLILADHIGSTAALLNYAKNSDAYTFIVATESGILHQMKKSCPQKNFIPAPPDHLGCGCNECSYMKQITLEKVRDSLRDLAPVVKLDEQTARRAIIPIQRMLELS